MHGHHCHRGTGMRLIIIQPELSEFDAVGRSWIDFSWVNHCWSITCNYYLPPPPPTLFFQVIKACHADNIERVRLEHEDALRRMIEMLNSTNALLNREIDLPQTTSANEAQACTLEYRTQLQEMKALLRKKVEIDLQVSFNQPISWIGLNRLPSELLMGPCLLIAPY